MARSHSLRVRRFCASCAAVLAGSILCESVRAETGSLSATKDSWIDQNGAAQTTNYGTETTAQVMGNPPNKRRMVVQFDLASLPGCVEDVTGGTLRLYVQSNSLSTTTTHNVHRLLMPWSENTVTWLTPWGAGPSAGGAYEPIQTATASHSSTGFVDYDVSVDVATFLGDPSANNGWILKHDVEGSGPSSMTVVSYAARENATAANRPQLVLTYTVVAGSCDDDNPCTDDYCTLTGCENVPNTASCDDGLFCNGNDVCSGGVCTHAGDPCAGGPECADVCNETANDCFVPSGTSCTSDGNVCTTDQCNGAGACTHTNNSLPCNDGVFCNGPDTCSGGICSVHAGNPCVGGAECNANCNEAAENCFALVGAPCADDGNVCTGAECNGAGTCVHPHLPGPCDDGDDCTQDDACFAGNCQGYSLCGNGTVDTQCGETCEPPNDEFCDETCGIVAVCGNGVIEPGEQCDDGNTLGGDCCDAVCQLTIGPCTDDNACTTGDVCTPLGCVGTPLDCSYLDSGCTSGQCDPQNGECHSVNVNEGGPCDDGDSCSANDVCIAGICSSCGNDVVDSACGETCDPPAAGSCDPTCLAVVCGNGVVQAGEECDDGNATGGDGCSAQCQFEEKICIPGHSPSVSRAAKFVAFASDRDYVGDNPDANEEIFVFQRKKFDKTLKVLVKKNGMSFQAAKQMLLDTRASEFFGQVTNTVDPVINEYPTLNGSGRVVAFVSNADLRPGSPGNGDGNREIFRIDRKLAARGDPSGTVQITDSPLGVHNLNPNLRAWSNLLMFDSNGNLAPDRCVGGTDDFKVCTTNADCTGACGNPEGNREVFVHIFKVYSFGDQPLRQVTAGSSGDSTVGQSQNFSTRATAFASTSNLDGQNPEFNSEIFRAARSASTLVPVTSSTSGHHSEPAQAVKSRIAFTSNGDLAGVNPDGNREVVLFDEMKSSPFSQLGATLGCLNAGPSIDAFGRFITFHSTCNRIPSLGNPDQSIFIWDDRKSKLLPLVVRGEGDEASHSPQATKRINTLTYVSSVDDGPGVCFLNVGALLKTLEKQ
jgi:cysteine-rich repeat protein